MPSMKTVAVSQPGEPSAENTLLTTSKTLYCLVANTLYLSSTHPSVSKNPPNG